VDDGVDATVDNKQRTNICSMFLQESRVAST
jgi:hypothetical protein